ncbi:MAG TPA: M56 family metallopeptidase [Dongiaceae bacterium]|nr:M56 family metallopeptidase [Dongiaceae bacterium]
MLHSFAELLVLRSMDSLIEGTGLCLLAAIALRLAPRQSAATRFAVWFSALLGVAVLPWLNWPVSGVTTAAAKHVAIKLPDSWALYFLGIWGVLAIWFGAGIARALWYLNVLRKDSVPVHTSKLDARLRQTLSSGAHGRTVDLCTCNKVRVPTALGLFRPAILIPGWVLEELSADDLNQVLLHEMAHLRRWDDWTNLAQQVLKALFFFHPAVWWMDNRVAVEREIACDDAVLRRVASPRAYAECLARLAERSFVNRGIALAQAALGKIWQTSVRIARILEPNRPLEAGRSWRPALALMAACTVGLAISYSRVPKLIAFEDSPPTHRVQVANAPTVATEPAPVVPVTQVKFSPASMPSKVNSRKTAQTSVRRNIAAKSQGMIRLAAAKSALAPATETVWVVVESRGWSPATVDSYEIQMWRVTVVQTVTRAPDRPIPPKQT